jgi:acylphosphatase
MKSRVHVYVSGRVQGVFFRAKTTTLAHSLGLAGWVRNLYDGRVEAVFEGEKESVEKAIEFCRRGPPGAYVDDLVVRWEEWRGEYRDFTIVY